MGVDDEGVGGRDDALHEDGHAQIPEVQAHLAHRQQRALVVLAGPHALHGRRRQVTSELHALGQLLEYQEWACINFRGFECYLPTLQAYCS